MAGDGGDKKFEPSENKKKAAIDAGDIPQSRDFSSAFTFAIFIVWIMVFGESLVGSIKHQMIGALERLHRARTYSGIDDASWHSIADIAKQFGFLAAGIWLGAIAGAVAVNAVGWRPGQASFKARRINPASGLKRMFGMTGAAEVAKSLVKVCLLSAVGSWFVVHWLMASGTGLDSDIVLFSKSLVDLFVAIGVTIMAIAGADVLAQRWMRRKRLLMSLAEVRDEARQSDGAPELKSRQRQRRMELLGPGVREAIASATVITVNPSHFAVALRYEPGADSAPVVVARGRNELAQLIRDYATESGVPLLSYPALTRSLYFTSKTGNLIHPDLYQAAAIVIAFVLAVGRDPEQYRANVKLPEVSIPAGFSFDPDGRREA